MDSWIDIVINNKYHIPFIILTRIRNLQLYIKQDLERFMKLKQAINSIEFSCFKEGGKCALRPDGSVCCCGSCDTQFGHFASTDIILSQNIKIYNKLFFPKTGFWHKHKGCLLPKELRSITCITYNCENSDKKLMIHTLSRQLNNLSSQIRRNAATFLSMHIMRGRLKRKGE